jgi:eukaryotic-like serine/threonine-protein kinase
LYVGRYRFVDRLAVGGMAEVFVAVAVGAEGFEKPVVIKRLLPDLAQMPRFQQMFLDEARIMINLQHGNIVQILDMGRMEGVPYLALEYVSGKDLRTVLRQLEESGDRLPHGLTAYIGSEVCRALDYAHRKTDDDGQPLNIVHRDVNPANIFLSHEGVVKVGDFGLAKARDNLDQSDAGIIKGKFSYLSPEQACGLEIDHRSDIFAIGVTIYEMACGVRPFEAETDVDVVLRVREARFTPPSQIAPGFSPELEAIILRAMSKDVERRYPTASQMREDLTRFSQQLPTPVGDRELADYLGQLFPERRSNSFLFKLAPVDSLPPTMISLSHDGPYSEFQHSVTPPLGMVASLLPPVAPPPTGVSPPPLPPIGVSPPPLPPIAPAPPSMTSVVAPLAVTPASGAARRSRAGLWIAIVAALGVVGAALAYVFLVMLKQPPTASLSLTSSPAGAAVLLDGAETGQRTPAVLRDLALGKDHVVTLRHPGAEEVRRTFRLDATGTHAYQFELTSLKEALTVESDPEVCDVLVDDELRGQTPLTLHLVRGKKHGVRLRRRGYLPKLVQHYAERASDTLRIQLEAEPRSKTARPRPPVAPRAAAGSGVLEVATEAKGSVFVDKRFVGRTPNFRMALPAGSYEIVVNPEGTKIRHAARITIVERQTHRLTLTPPPSR